MADEPIALEIESGQHPRRTERLKPGAVTFGRSSSADVQIMDEGLSRLHFQITSGPEGWSIRDLKSRNGTYVNMNPIQTECRLAVGDVIRAGTTVFTVIQAPSEPSPDVDDDKFSRTMALKADQLSEAFWIPPGTGPGAEAARSLTILNAFSREILGITGERELYAHIVRTLPPLFQADRCAIALTGGPEALLDYRIADFFSLRGRVEGDLRLSRAVLKKVFEDKMAILIADSGLEKEIAEARSILSQNIRSVLCAPLLHKDAIYGLLYVDIIGRPSFFSQEHLGLLSAMANLVAVKIKNLQFEVQALERARMERELDIAASIQARMLPPADFAFPDFALSAYHRPCYEVGGDYYDFIISGGGVLTVTIGDVSGKGAPGAILMAACKSMLTAFVEAAVPIGERIERLNRYILAHSSAEKFVTLFHAEMEAGAMVYVNAGHNPSLLLTAGGEVERMEATGMPLGVMDVSPEVRRADFAAGDRLVLYTDGVVEAADGRDVEYGLVRLEHTARDHAASTPEELRDAVLSDVRRFCGRDTFADDLTLVVVERRT